MKSKKTTLLFLVILYLYLAASFILEVRALTPQSQTVKITDTHDDMFITEVGIGIDSSLVTIKDPGMDIRSFLVFRELEVNYWEPLENATLRLHTSNTLDFDADSSISIYGIALSDLQVEGWLLPSTVLSLGFTDAVTNYNTSEFYGGQWHEIEVTDIVEELIRNPNWDGDGSAGTETGDAIGFHILGAEGNDKRYFYDYKTGNGLEAQLILHWNHEPPPPAGYENAEYNETYRGYDIWFTEGGWLNYTSFTLSNSSGNILELNSTYFIFDTYNEDDNDYLRKVWDDSGIIRRKWGITYTEFKDNTGAEGGYIHVQWGVSEIAGPMTTWDNGYAVAMQQDSGATNRERARLLCYEGGGIEFVTIHQYYTSAELPITFWFDVTINLDTSFYNVTIYNDEDMTSMNDTIQGTFGDFPDDDLFTTEFAIGPAYGSNPSGRDYDSGIRYSKIDFEEGYLVVDNGTVIDVFPDYPDAIEGIDDILGADPEDPTPPGQGWDETGPYTRFRTRLYIFLMGFGLLFGPLFYFAMRRPSGYEFVIGLFIMLVGYSFLLAAAGI